MDDLKVAVLKQYMDGFNKDEILLFDSMGSYADWVAKEYNQSMFKDRVLENDGCITLYYCDQIECYVTPSPEEPEADSPPEGSICYEALSCVDYRGNEWVTRAFTLRLYKDGSHEFEEHA